MSCPGKRGRDGDAQELCWTREVEHTFRVGNFFEEQTRCVLSDPFTAGFPGWRLEVHPQGDARGYNYSPDNQYCSVYLDGQHVVSARGATEARVTFSVINKQGQHDLGISRLTCTLTFDEYDYKMGFTQCFSLPVLRCVQGYMDAQGGVTFRVQVQVRVPSAQLKRCVALLTVSERMAEGDMALAVAASSDASAGGATALLRVHRALLSMASPLIADLLAAVEGAGGADCPLKVEGGAVAWQAVLDCLYLPLVAPHLPAINTSSLMELASSLPVLHRYNFTALLASARGALVDGIASAEHHSNDPDCVPPTRLLDLLILGVDLQLDDIKAACLAALGRLPPRELKATVQGKLLRLGQRLGWDAFAELMEVVAARLGQAV